MKKRGFTLAEILVSLGVIGVVSALTLPTFISNTQTRTHETTANTSVMAIENAIGNIFAQDGANTLNETEIVNIPDNVADTDTGKFLTRLDEFLKSNENVDRNLNPNPNGTPRMLKNGSIASFDIDDIDAEANDIAGTVTIDTNGAARPNINNIDRFTYNLMGNGELVRQ